MAHRHCERVKPSEFRRAPELGRGHLQKDRLVGHFDRREGDLHAGFVVGYRLDDALTLLARFSVDGSLHFICMDWRHMRELLDAGKAAYTELKNLCVWAKDNCGMGSLYRSQH